MMKKNSYVLFTGVLMILILFCICGTVKGQNREDIGLNMKYYGQLEQDYQSNIRKQLQNLGYENAGVILCRIMDVDGSVVYTLSIHHRRIDNMNDEQRKELIKKLSIFKLGEENFKVETKFVEYNC